MRSTVIQGIEESTFDATEAHPDTSFGRETMFQVRNAKSRSGVRTSLPAASARIEQNFQDYMTTHDRPSVTAATKSRPNRANFDYGV